MHAPIMQKTSHVDTGGSIMNSVTSGLLLEKHTIAHVHSVGTNVCIEDNAVTSSIRIAQVFPDLVSKKTRALWKVYGANVKLYN